MISRLIVKLAYLLLAFEPYQSFKKKANDLLNNDKNRYKKYLDSFMITMVITSIIILISDMRRPEHDFWDVFNYYVISFMFLVEYLFRFWVASDSSKIIIAQHEKDTQLQRPFQLFVAIKNILYAKWQYMRRPMAIIDLLAAIPFSNEYGLLRTFVFFRIFKLFRYSKSLQMFGSVLATKRFEFLTIFIFASIIILVSSILFYITEAPSPSSPVETLYAAVYWSIVTMSTVGYGDIVPTTNAGRFIAMVVIFAGVAVLSFVTSIFVSAMTEKLDQMRETRLLDSVASLRQFYLICGYSEAADLVAKKLNKAGHDIVVMDTNADNLAKAKNAGFAALDFDSGQRDSYLHAGIDFKTQVKAVLCLQEDDIQNVYTTLTFWAICMVYSL
jgi:voltage-gated potassium channel